MTSSTVRVLRVLVVRWPSRFDRSYVMSGAVASQAELIDRTVFQQARVRRSVRRMTSRAAFGLHRSVFERERSLLVCVTLDASCISSCREPGLFRLETAVRVVTIAATHRAFQNFVVEGR